MSETLPRAITMSNGNVFGLQPRQVFDCVRKHMQDAPPGDGSVIYSSPQSGDIVTFVHHGGRLFVFFIRYKPLPPRTFFGSVEHLVAGSTSTTEELLQDLLEASVEGDLDATCLDLDHRRHPSAPPGRRGGRKDKRADFLAWLSRYRTADLAGSAPELHRLAVDVDSITVALGEKLFWTAVSLPAGFVEHHTREMATAVAVDVALLLARIDEHMPMALHRFGRHCLCAPFRRNGCRDLAKLVAANPVAARKAGLDTSSLSLNELARTIDELDQDAMVELLLALELVELVAD
jgi:hypothetical protein